MRYDHFHKKDQCYFYIVAHTMAIYSPDSRTCRMSDFIIDKLMAHTGLTWESLNSVMRLMLNSRLFWARSIEDHVYVEFRPEFWTLLALFSITDEDIALLEAA